MVLTTTQRRWILGVALALTLAAVASTKGNDESDSGVVQPVKARMHQQQKEEAGGELSGYVPLAKLNRQRFPEDVKDMFAGKSWYVAPPPMAATPTAPPMPFVYSGKLAEEGGKAVIFLTRQDRLYTVREGDVLDNNYRVDEVRPPLMILTYLPLNIKQTMRIGESN